MLEIFYDKNNLVIENKEKKQILFDYSEKKVLLDNFDVTFPGEYEKSGILLEVKEYNGNLYYNFLIEDKHLIIITEDNFELKQDISDFFGDVDILVIVGTKDATKIFENIEAKIVVPYGESKDIFLNTLGQHPEEVEKYKQKGELPIDTTEFVNIKI